MFGFREQAVSLYCQSKHLGLQSTTSLVVYQVRYARIGPEDALHGNKRGQCFYPAIVNSVTVLKTLVQYLPSSKMSNACQFVDLDASVTRKTILSRQQFSFNCLGPNSNHRTSLHSLKNWTEKTVEVLFGCFHRGTTNTLMLRHFESKFVTTVLSEPGTTAPTDRNSNRDLKLYNYSSWKGWNLKKILLLPYCRITTMTSWTDVLQALGYSKCWYEGTFSPNHNSAIICLSTARKVWGDYLSLLGRLMGLENCLPLSYIRVHIGTISTPVSPSPGEVAGARGWQQSKCPVLAFTATPPLPNHWL